MTTAPVTAPPAARAPAPEGGRRRSTTRPLVGWAFVAPFAVVFLVFLVAPLAYAFYLSLYTKGLATGTRFAGLENYRRAFTDETFLRGVSLVARFSLALIPFQMAVSLGMALLLDGLTSRFARFGRLMIFMPYAIPAVIGALMWGFLYSRNFGPLFDLFGAFGASAPDLLGRELVFFGLMNVVTWQWAGYYMIILYAALQGIDPTLYEAARIDGASTWQIVLRIKIPLVVPALLLILVFAIIGTLQFFNEPQILRYLAAGSIPADYTPNMYAYTLAFSYGQFNYASAISFALGIVVFVCVYAFLFATRRKGSFLR